MNVVTATLAEQALAASGLVAWRWDRATDHVEWSAGADRILDLPDIVLRSPSLLVRAVHADDVPMLSDAFAMAGRTGAPLSARFRVTSAGGMRWFDLSGQVLRDDDMQMSGATGTLIDVTEECEAEEAVLGALHDAECVLETIGARLWEWDSVTDRVTYFRLPESGNLITAAPTDVPMDEILARMHEADARLVRETFAAAIAGRGTFTLEVALRDDDDVERRALVRGGLAAGSTTRVSAVSVLFG